MASFFIHGVSLLLTIESINNLLLLIWMGIKYAKCPMSRTCWMRVYYPASSFMRFALLSSCRWMTNGWRLYGTCWNDRLLMGGRTNYCYLCVVKRLAVIARSQTLSGEPCPTREGANSVCLWVHRCLSDVHHSDHIWVNSLRLEKGSPRLSGCTHGEAEGLNPHTALFCSKREFMIELRFMRALHGCRRRDWLPRQGSIAPFIWVLYLGPARGSELGIETSRVALPHAFTVLITSNCNNMDLQHLSLS